MKRISKTFCWLYLRLLQLLPLLDKNKIEIFTIYEGVLFTVKGNSLMFWEIRKWDEKINTILLIMKLQGTSG